MFRRFFAFAENEEMDYLISAQKFGSNKYIAVTFNVNPETEPVTIYYTSANDKLYMLMAEQQTLFPTLLKTSRKIPLALLAVPMARQIFTLKIMFWLKKPTNFSEKV